MECGAERDERLMQLVSAALERPVAERDSFLRLACQQDQDLFREALEVLDGEQKMGSFLLHPAISFKESSPPFQAGQLVAERFEIIRLLGEGGMGWVYEAFDRKLNRRIAIKSAKPGFQPTLSPEIKGALAVSHPNICRVNEIHTAHTSQGDLDFLTMELLEGETLSAYLNTHGKLPAQEALAIAKQLCEGLAEAHRRGIIHRDLKTGNVILCKTQNGDRRVVITDFGLAGDTAQTTDLGGTPKYIAPELWQGARASIASDLYALGVILYEMIAGPHVRDQISTANPSDQTTTTITTVDPEVGTPLERSLRGVPHRWAHVIAQCFDPQPERRPANAGAVISQLTRSHILRAVGILVPLLILASLAFPGIRARLHDTIWPPPSARLVILPPVASDDAKVTAEGALQDAADRITHARNGLRTIAVIHPAQAREEQVQNPEQAGKILHATHALQTTFRHEGLDLVVQGSVIDLQSDMHLTDFSSRYSADTQGSLAAALAAQVSTALHLRGQPSEQIAASATPAYDRGLYYLRLDVQDTADAITSFQDAHQSDPRSPLPLAGLVEAELDEFDESPTPDHLDRARQYLEMAESLDADSVRVHLAGGMFDETTSEFEQALDQYRRVAEIEPRNEEAFIRIAGVYDKQNLPDKALESFHHAIELDPTYYNPHEYLGVFYFHRGNYSEAAAEFQQVIALAPGMYNAYTNLGASLEKLDRTDDAEKALRSSLALRETPRALNNMGSLLYSERRFPEAIPYLQRAVALTPGDYVVLLNLADCHRQLGHGSEAKRDYRNAMGIAMAGLNQNPGSGYARAFVAYFAARIGDRERAQDEIKQALRLSPGNNTVLHRAILTYETLGLRADALATLKGATPDLIHSLQNDPDLADFCRDSRFIQMTAPN